MSPIPLDYYSEEMGRGRGTKFGAWSTKFAHPRPRPPPKAITNRKLSHNFGHILFNLEISSRDNKEI